jgi:pimeloyl-ACP methyl ester carboxylesterase
MFQSFDLATKRSTHKLSRAFGTAWHPPQMVTGPVPGMRYRRIEVRGAAYFVAMAGSGSPVLLLHGFPQTHYSWRRVVPSLARTHRVVAADLRGYGATEAPAGGPHGEGYSKRELAADVVELADVLASNGSAWWGTIAAAASPIGSRSTMPRGWSAWLS